MINLDRYLNNTVELIFMNETYHIREAGVGVLFAVRELEKDLSADNIYDKRVDTALLLMNSNTEGRVFKKEELMEIPFEGVEALVKELSGFRLKAENDPNLKSPSQMGK